MYGIYLFKKQRENKEIGLPEVAKTKFSKYFTIIALIVLAGIVIATRYFPEKTSSSSGEFERYTLNVSDIRSYEPGFEQKGTLIISHNAIAAFPLDLRAEYTKIEEISPTTIIEAQTKATCSENSREILFKNKDIIKKVDAFGPLKIKDTADIQKISLEMPYHTSQDNYTRIPRTFCVGFHIKDEGWVFNFNPITPTLDDTLKTGYGEIVVDERNVDVIAILFDSTTAINKIEFEARKVD